MTGEPAKANADIARATVSNVIIRGCANCGHPRTRGVPCEGCGNPSEPVVHDLGVQSYYHKSRLKRAGWALVGQRLAARTARAAGRGTRRG